MTRRTLTVCLLLAATYCPLGLCSIWFQPSTTTTVEEPPQSPKVVATNNGNYSISFVPLITLLAGMLPRLINKIRTPTTNARELEPKMLTGNTVATGPTVPIPGVPDDFKGANPCLDSILARRPYPGNVCFFYQCEIFEPSTPICRLQALQDPDSPQQIDYRTVEKKSSILRISECLAIRLYRCSIGHVYDKTLKKCIRKPNTPFGEDRCTST